jgi:hypothetical protein
VIVLSRAASVSRAADVAAVAWALAGLLAAMTNASPMKADAAITEPRATYTALRLQTKF